MRLLCGVKYAPFLAIVGELSYVASADEVASAEELVQLSATAQLTEAPLTVERFESLQTAASLRFTGIASRLSNPVLCRLGKNDTPEKNGRLACPTRTARRAVIELRRV